MRGRLIVYVLIVISLITLVLVTPLIQDAYQTTLEITLDEKDSLYYDQPITPLGGKPDPPSDPPTK